MRLAKRPLVAACLLLLMSACKPEMHIAVVDKAKDEAAIRHVLDEVSRTFSAGDYEGMFALYRDDVIVASPGQPEIAGKAAWRAGLGALPQGVVMKMRFDTQELEIDHDLAYERGTFVIEAKDPKSDAYVPVVTARHVHIFRREADGSWKGWRLFENSSDPSTALLPQPQPPRAAK